MELKPGYKQTEVGVIPEDWQVIPLGDIGTFKNGINKDSDAFGHGYPFVNLMDVFGVSRISSSDQLGLIASTNFEQQTYNLKRGDVIFIRSSVKPSGVGLTAVVEDDLSHTVFSGFLIRFRDSGYLDNLFKRHCFYEAGFRNRVIGASSVSANTNINQDSLRRLPLPIPPTKAEQEAIAEALSDADALIESLEQLIAKKRDIKQGAMQELLTGKKRLPGFDGEWDVKPLGQVASKFVNGGTPPTSNVEYWSGDIPWITGADIVNQEITQIRRFITNDAISHSSTNLVEKGNLLIVTRTGVGKLAIAPYDLAISQDLTGVFLIKQLALPEYLYHYFIYASEELTSLNQGTSIAGITRDTLTSVKIRVPTISEQQAIVTVLSAMDAEIAALEAKLEKARQVKLGMMQELLTGRIRLK